MIPVSPEFLSALSAPLDIDAILASLPEELNDPGVDPWGGASLCPDFIERPAS